MENVAVRIRLMFRVPALVAVLLWLLLLPASAGQLQEVTLYPAGAPDAAQLFTPAGLAQWATARGFLSHFETNIKALGERSDSELAAEFAVLNSEHIGLDLAIDPASGVNHCDDDANAKIAKRDGVVAQRLYRLGAPLGRVVLDGPLDWGHFFSGDNVAGHPATPCQYSVKQIAAYTLQTVNAFREYYPKLQIVDDEGDCGMNATELVLGARCPPPILPDFEQWVALIHPVSIRLDHSYKRKNWQATTRIVLDELKKLNLPYGIYINNSLGMHNPAEWIASAEENIAIWAAFAGDQPPDDVTIVSPWGSAQVNLLAQMTARYDDRPGTLSSLVVWYCTSGPYAGRCKGASYAR
jgi:hypothetical protein